MYVGPVGIFVPSACVYYIYANVLALYVPGVGRITRYKSSVMYVLSSICTAVPCSLGLPYLSRRSRS